MYQPVDKTFLAPFGGSYVRMRSCGNAEAQDPPLKSTLNRQSEQPGLDAASSDHSTLLQELTIAPATES
ncbi:hypothetical protein PoB_003212500 [Plakobranchus ocellatus]|uniref:Uncharacterized protein n=1 Tax=Plakobranchus ocellatus TaxID=259542 RepID=A0AAV4ABT1_9GAST|nr:hypothetical protein PoB_003212500 [Plakobranchus ocellatus]